MVSIMPEADRRPETGRESEAWIDVLGRLDFFSELAREDLRKLLSTARVESAAPGEVIIRQGDPGSDMYVVLEGNVEVSRRGHDQELCLARLGSGDMVGEFSLLDRGPRSATVTARTATTLLALGREEFLSHMTRAPQVMVKILAGLSRRVRDANEKYIEELTAKNQALESACEALRELDDRKTKFIDLASHELLSPLTILSLFFGFLRDPEYRNDPDRMRDACDSIQSSLSRLTSIFENLIQLASRGDPENGTARDRVEPAELVSRVLAEILPVLRARNIEIESRVEDGLPPVLVHRAHVEQAILNILMHSIRSTPDGGTMSIATVLCADSPGAVELTVSDSAPALEELAQKRIFEPFYEPASTLNHSSGTYQFLSSAMGLELAVARKFAEDSGGVIDVSSLPGQGNRFRLVLRADESSGKESVIGPAALEKLDTEPPPMEARGVEKLIGPGAEAM